MLIRNEEYFNQESISWRNAAYCLSSDRIKAWEKKASVSDLSNLCLAKTFALQFCCSSLKTWPASLEESGEKSANQTSQF